MADQELIKQVAEKVMGWTYFKIDGKGRFSKKNYAFFVDRDGSHLSDGYWEIEWNPITNANHWLMVVERMVNDNWHIRIDNDPEGGFDVEFYKAEDEQMFTGEGDGPIGYAVCMAALKAGEGQ